MADTVSPKRVCIIGIGGIARVYGAALKELAGSATLVGGCCRTEDKGRAYAEEFGCTWYSSYEEMLDTEKPDVALVTTPSGYHLEPTLACAERKVHVLCDKPLEITAERCDTMIEACDAAGVHLGCIFQSRFTPELQPLHAAAQAGRFGPLSILSGYVPWYRDDAYYAPSRWQGTQAMDGGGACMNQAIHTIDVLIWLAGAADGGGGEVPDVNPVAEVVAFTAQRAHSADLIEVEGTAVASLRFRSGGLGQILGATSMYPGSDRLVWLAGRDGTAELRGDEITRWEFRTPQAEDESMTKPKVVEKVASGGAASPFANFNTGPPRSNIQSFLESLDASVGESTYPVGGREAKKAVQVVQAIYEAARTGKSVAIE